MKNFAFAPYLKVSGMPFLYTVALLLTIACAQPLAAQPCAITCKDLLEVQVPANGIKELLPADIAEVDLSVVCPNGVFQTQAQIGNINWVPSSGNVVFSATDIGQTYLARLSDAVTGNTCWGNVQIVAAAPLNDTLHIQLCTEFWADGRAVNGATLTFQPINPAFPYTPIVLTLDSTHHCAEITVKTSDYLPGTTFSYSATMPNNSYVNGVNVMDLCQISKHILGIQPLPSPYALFAADANKSGSITTFDIVESRKVILGVYSELPSNVSWQTFPDYCQFPNPSNPFTGLCQPDITLSQLIALDGDTAKVIVAKTCDVNGDAQLINKPYVPSFADSLTIMLPQGQVAAGSVISIPIKLDKNFNFGSLQANFNINQSLVQYDSISQGALSFSTPNAVSFYNNSTGNFRVAFPGDLTFGPQFVPAGTPLFYIHVKALQNTSLEEALQTVTNDPFAQNMGIGPNCEGFFQIGSTYAGSVPTYAPTMHGLRVQPPSPNPFAEQATLSMELEKAETALLEVTDLTGCILFSETKELPAGLSRWEIPASALSAGSLGIWQLRIGGQMTAGKLVRR